MKIIFEGSEEAFAHLATLIEGYTNNELQQLISTAKNAMAYSYAPYSHFNVGAAVLAEKPNNSGMFGGANQENAAYSPTLCGESVAIARAVNDNFRLIRAVAVCGGPDSTATETVRKAIAQEWCAPCGRCRQMIHEFAHPDCLAILIRGDGLIRVLRFDELFPMPFGPRSVGINPAAYRP